MKNIVLNYLNKNYRFSLSTFNSFILKGRRGEADIKLSALIEDLKVIFSITENEITPFIDAWADYQTTLIYNRVADIKERLYKEGVTVELSPTQYNIIMDDEDTINPNRW